MLILCEIMEYENYDYCRKIYTWPVNTGCSIFLWYNYNCMAELTKNACLIVYMKQYCATYNNYLVKRILSIDKGTI